MKKTKKHFCFLTIYLALFVTFHTSCNKYLDIQSNKNQVVPEDLTDLQQILDGSQNINFNFCSIVEVSADNYFLKQKVFDGLNEVGRKFYTWENPVYNFNNDWAKAYITVYNCNLVLDKIKEIKRAEANKNDWDNVKGSALYYRASQYLSLVWTYSKAYQDDTSPKDLGIVLRSTSDFNVKSERATVLKSYRVIVDDLLAAADILPDKAIHVMRPSKIAAYAGLARAYHSMAKYDSAYYYSDKVLSVNKELMDYNNAAEVKILASYPFTRFNKETLGYFELVTINAQIGVNNANIDSTLYQSYHVNDLRKQAFFKMNADGYVSFKGSYAGSANLFGGPAVDEMFLIRAECAVRKGSIREGMDDMDYLLSRRYKIGSYIPAHFEVQDEALDFVLQERRKELLFRGLRWMDLKRLNEEGRGIQLKRNVNGKEYMLKPRDNKYALPLPEDVIMATGMLQNPI